MKQLLKLAFETKDFQFNTHRLVMFPEAKVYARGVIKESKDDSIKLIDDLDMAELERRLLKDNYTIKTLAEVEGR